MDKKTIKRASIILASMRSIEKLSGVVNVQAVEKVLGKDFKHREGNGYKMTLKRFQDDPTKGYFVFERTKD